MNIEERVNQLGDKAGPKLAEPLIIPTQDGRVARIGLYYNCVLFEVGNEVWTFPEGTIANSFLDRPG